ncbi:MAG TPA: peptidase S10 [Anaerolineae bacterium]|nr:peptidase S10 [Anaerolineae bacterium]
MSDKPAEPTEKSTEEKMPEVKDQLVTTEHRFTLNGQEITYTVTTGTLVLKEESEKSGDKAGEAEGEKPKATVFFVAYTRTDIEDTTRRPITFSFNGGPGSASVWLHLGALGPRRVAMGDVDQLLPPPYGLTDNAYSVLDVTDLVFIDPMLTGYSRPVVGEKAKDFLNFKKDIESVGDFIRLYTTRYQRWLSPKFLIGESYGTTRAAGLSGYLQERHGLYLNGIMLVSSILDFGTAEAHPGNDLPYILYLPTYAATAWYHQRLKGRFQRDLHKLLAEVEQFALTDYASTLLRGASVPAKTRAVIIEQLAAYTGLSTDYLDRVNLRIEIMRFTKELLRNQHRTVGRLDSRFTGIDRDSGGEMFEHDPSMSATSGPFTAAFYDYVRRELKFESDLPYEVLNFKANEQWSFAQHENRYVEVAETLRKAIAINPHLKIFVANGYFDLATPYFATEYTFNHLSLDPSLQSNIVMGYYEAGHMMYVHEPSLAKLKQDLAAFIPSALPTA